MKLRTHLIFLVIAALVPALIFSGVMIFLSYRQQRGDIERGLVDTARALSLAVDRELLASIRTLQALGASEHLGSGNLKQFYEQAGRVLKTQPDWTTIVLFDSDERQVLNLLRPFGSPLPIPPAGLRIREAVELKRPLVSDLFFGRVARELRVAVTVPVIHTGEVKYVLAVPALPAFVAKLLKEQNIPEDWLATVIDRKKIIIARTKGMDKFLGMPATPLFAAKSAESAEGFFKGRPYDEAPVYTGFRRSELSGWTVGLAIPASAIEAPLARSLMLTAIGGLILLAGGGILATILGRRISRAAAQLAAGAQALGRGGTPRLPLSPIVELDQVGREIEVAAVNHKQMEAVLRASEERFRTLAEAAPIGIFLTSPTGECVYTNPAWSAISGLSSEESLGYGWMRAIHPDDREKVQQSWQAAASRGENYTTDYRIATPAGEIRWAHVLATLQVDASGTVVSYVGSVEDTTERKRAEQETERNFQRIEALRAIDQAITSSLDLHSVLHVLLEKTALLWPFAAVSTVRLLNRETGEFAFLACQGVDEKEWNRSRIGARSRKIVATKTPLAVRNVDADPLTYHHEIFHKYGLVSYLGVPLIVKDKVLGVLSIYTKQEREFTKEEIEFLASLASQASVAIHNAQLYEEMVKANKVKEEFLSVMSHELRTPLSVVTGYVGMVKDRLLGEINPQQEEALQKVLARAEEQLGLINDIMQTTMLEVNTPAVERQAVDLGELFNDLKDAYHFSASKKNLKLVWDCPPSPPRIVTDGAKLRQILQNLIGNAIKFTDAGTVTIAARLLEGASREAEGGKENREASPVVRRSSDETRDTNDEIRATRWLELRVTDTGAGMPPDKLHLIFDKFYQLDSSETRLYGGVGLGLYIVKHFTELLGGKVAVESRRGSGTTFTVSMPVEMATN